jgi:hypothetical protein
MQNSHFHHTFENGLTTPWKSQNTASLTFLADGVLITVNFLAELEGELGCFHSLKHTLIQVGSAAPMICPQ